MLGNVGDFSPDYKTVFVAEVIEILVMLIVRKTDGGCTYLHDEADVLSMMLGKKCVAEADSVLMTGNTSQGVFLAVEDKASFGVNLEGTAAEA